jgi:hypothetical protein
MSFKICTKNMYFYCTQLVSTIDILHHVSKVCVHPVSYFGGLKPWALGVDHAIGAVPRGQLSDGCARGGSQFGDHSVRGLIPQTSIWYINVRDSRSREGDTMSSEMSGGKTHIKQSETGVMNICSLFVHIIKPATYTILLLTVGS